MPSAYQPRRPRASPLWQLVHHGWDDFLARRYETRHQCPDCGHERLLAFTSKGATSVPPAARPWLAAQLPGCSANAAEIRQGRDGGRPVRELS